MSDSSPRHPPLDTPPEPEPELPALAAEANGAGAVGANAVVVGTDSPSADTVTTARGETTEVELTRAQHTFARRVAESQATIPQLTLQVEVDLEECVAGREAGGPEPCCTAEIVRACALALREHPRVNSSYRDGRVQMHSRVNIGVAVSVGDGEAPEATAKTTVIAPTVFDADTLTRQEIGFQIGELRVRAQEGTLTPPELSGTTFTVVDFDAGEDDGRGVDAFTATVQPGQAAILTVGSVRPRPVVTGDGRVVVHRTATLTLSCDHRMLHGADAARFLAWVRELLEASVGA